MNGRSFADETLEAILHTALDVADEDFISCDKKSPFANRQHSSSDALLVCKRWLRVATPLLYHTVVIRTRLQAQALIRVVKKNPTLGRHCKKLRLETGAELLGDKLLNGLGNLKDICFAMDSHGQSSYRLAPTLHLVAPKRVIVTADMDYPLREGLDRVLKDGLWKIVRLFFRSEQ